MGFVLELPSEMSILKLVSNENRWCRCSLISKDMNTLLGAERSNYIVSHLLEGLSENEKTLIGAFDGYPVYWVLSLAEAHYTLYMANKINGKVLFWQNEEAQIITTMEISEGQKKEWIEKLQI